ncbi:hypothetical protein HNR19_000952 [Nocardioides thalensis]|uniref:Uncharacterized protein n=1 Tax=Nocardioides thalensis TaxID=1914755 RepID=A0A853BYY0_9ACTN|nr:hypothetical protein [Nocardioides thalensis]NYJ00254.1 hypothetical protein [Nocardioides thalensis]
MTWKYERDETPRRKHQWDRDEPGFVEVNGVTVGKCPSSMTVARAEAALNSGYEYRPRRGWTADYPERIYAVLDGVVYRATPTNPGVSYHGFPELREKFKDRREVRDAIMELAKRDGSEKEVSKWLSKA